MCYLFLRTRNRKKKVSGALFCRVGWNYFCTLVSFVTKNRWHYCLQFLSVRCWANTRGYILVRGFMKPREGIYAQLPTKSFVRALGWLDAFMKGFSRYEITTKLNCDCNWYIFNSFAWFNKTGPIFPFYRERLSFEIDLICRMICFGILSKV